MKKTIKILTVTLLVCLVSMLALTACNFEKLLENADWIEEAEYTDKESCVGAINSFFEETLKDPDFVVTCKNKAGEVQFTETVKGTDSFTLGKDGSKTYVYKIGDFYYWVSVEQTEYEEGETVEQHMYYCSDSSKVAGYCEDAENYYNSWYCLFMSNITVISWVPEKDASFHCVVNGEKTDGAVSNSLTLECTATGGTITITAASEENLVKNVHIVLNDTTDPSASRDLTLTFEYGSASITLPDTDAWDREEAARRQKIEDNEAAIAARDEFLSSTIAENVKVTVMDYLKSAALMTETFANDIDFVDYGDYKTYAYTKTIDDDSWENYLVMDAGEEKTYTKNSESFGDNCLVWYALYISAYDELVETADFSCTITDGAMTYNVKVDNEVIFSISVAANQDPIMQIDISGFDDDGNRTVIGITLEYNRSELSEPDLSNYTYIPEDADESGEEVEE